jgi:hypothetical protein
MSNTNTMNAASKSPLAKAFQTVRGAIKRGDQVELRCKRIFLASVVRDLPGTIWADEAEAGLVIVNQMIIQK